MLFTIKQDLKDYNASILKADLLAGLTVAVIVIPQAMAYALLAGLPPIYGLYAAFVPILVYPFFGSSKALSVGPVALVSIIVLAGLSKLAAPDTDEFIQLALLTSLIAGLIQIILSVFRFGFLVKFLSEPVVTGFTFAAAIIIGFSQIKHIFGVPFANSNTFFTMVQSLYDEIANINPYTVIIGGAGLALIFALKKINNNMPAALIAVILGAMVVYLTGWQNNGVGIVGDVPKGLPMFKSNFISVQNALAVLPTAILITLISFIESMAIAKSISAKNNNYPISANKELLGLGLAKVIGSFFQAYPNTGSFSRSAINDSAGAKTGISSLFSGLLVGLTLVFFTHLFYYLPKPVLGAIVIYAVVGLVNIDYIKRLKILEKKDFYVFLATFILTLLLGVKEGVLIGVFFSIVYIIFKASEPHYAVLGRLEGTGTYRNVERYPDTIVIRDEIFIFRYDNDIFFANAEHFYDSVLSELQRFPKAKTIIFDCSAITTVDTTALHKFELLGDALDKRGIEVVLASLTGPVRDFLHKSYMYRYIGEENMYLTVQDAVDGVISNTKQSALSREYASQTNYKR